MQRGLAFSVRRRIWQSSSELCEVNFVQELLEGTEVFFKPQTRSGLNMANCKIEQSPDPPCETFRRLGCEGSRPWKDSLALVFYLALDLKFHPSVCLNFNHPYISTLPLPLLHCHLYPSFALQTFQRSYLANNFFINILPKSLGISKIL